MSLVAKHVGKVIGNPPNRILTDISVEIQNGEFVALTGRSGSGKSTLLYILSSLDTPSEGHVSLNGKDLSRMTKTELSQLRNADVGFIFQFHYLLAELSALENVLMPARKAGAEAQKKAHAESLLERFGLGDKLRRLPRQLSGGEQQRVAIARALVMDPKYLFADEPTGSLDSINGELVMQIIQDANQKLKTSVIMVTHDPHFAEMAHRQIHLADGKII